MRLRNSFWALLGREISETPAVVAERIRKAMLFALDDHCGKEHHALDLRINVARDIAELWYLRPDLMQAISVSSGEVIARGVLAQITVLFEGHQPGATPSRFGSL